MSEQINPLIDEVNRKLENYCNANDRVHFLDLRGCMLDNNGNDDRRKLNKDGLHLSRMGLSCIADDLSEKVDVIRAEIVSRKYETHMEHVTQHWPELPKAAVSSRVKPDQYPGQIYFEVRVTEQPRKERTVTKERTEQKTEQKKTAKPKRYPQRNAKTEKTVVVLPRKRTQATKEP